MPIVLHECFRDNFNLFPFISSNLIFIPHFFCIRSSFVQVLSDRSNSTLWLVIKHLAKVVNFVYFYVLFFFFEPLNLTQFFIAEWKLFICIFVPYLLLKRETREQCISFYFLVVLVLQPRDILKDYNFIENFLIVSIAIKFCQGYS